MRSVWKYPPLALLSNKLYRTSKANLSEDSLGRRLSAYNGKKLESLIVRPYMLGQKISNFLSSRYSGKNIHIKKKKRKK